MTPTSGQSKSRRPPIVVVLGHIDHGKTTLLDKVRKTSVAAKESGGITQHVGAYEIELTTKKGTTGKITFIDTPGHEAFSKMRSRGAGVADVALLVVAADDGVKPQTEEALRAIREAKIPFIVVLNKIDKDAADPDRVKKELGDKEVYLEEWGGKVPLVKISAKSGEGIEDLLEMILLVSELENLECDFSLPASGVVVESRLDPKRGNGATLLLRAGSLTTGDFVSAGAASVKVRILEDFTGKTITKARASSPVLVVGFDKIPPVGSIFQAFGSREELDESLSKAVKESGATKVASPEGKVLVPVILKADTVGSLEALEFELKKFEKGLLGLNILRSGLGSISEDDLKLASSSPETLVLGFKVKIERSAQELAGRFGLTVKIFEIIYELGDFVEGELEKRLPEEKEEKALGHARVLKIFKKDGSRQIVGGRVSDGGVFEGRKVKLYRRDFFLAEGKILEVQVGKTRTKEVSAGNEFGALVDVEFEVAPGDTLEVFEEVFQKKKLFSA